MQTIQPKSHSRMSQYSQYSKYSQCTFCPPLLVCHFETKTLFSFVKKTAFPQRSPSPSSREWKGEGEGCILKNQGRKRGRGRTTFKKSRKGKGKGKVIGGEGVRKVYSPSLGLPFCKGKGKEKKGNFCNPGSN